MVVVDDNSSLICQTWLSRLQIMADTSHRSSHTQCKLSKTKIQFFNKYLKMRGFSHFLVPYEADTAGNIGLIRCLFLLDYDIPYKQGLSMQQSWCDVDMSRDCWKSPEHRAHQVMWSPDGLVLVGWPATEAWMSSSYQSSSYQVHRVSSILAPAQWH